ncbi:uncharacterized protein BDV14DRAFT_149455 [Aspergillus stella-maris]|uniref:uncharacterized protein n=1 Tax=Aspergillus stella-maris TaxID=1810926 RepID=UPI003CCD917E
MLTGSSPDVGRSLDLHYQFGDQPQRLILPPEILQMINEYIMGGRPDRPDYLKSVPPQLCRVNSTWNRIFTPALYAHYKFQGGINNLSSLYNFLHTLVHRPERSKMVQELTLTTWDIHEDLQFEPRNLRQTFLLLWRYTDIFDRCWAIRRLKQTDHNSLANRQAFKSFCATCLWSDGTIKTEWKEPLKAAYAVAHDKIHCLWLDPVLKLVLGDLVLSGMVGHGKATGPAALASITQTPLTALIIALCPNLIRLNCDVWGVGEDPFFERIVRIATGNYPLPRAFRGKYRPMHKVESIQASGREMLVNPCYPSPSRGKTSISDYKNYWHLPRLKSLTILNAEMARDLKIRHPSTIEQLTLMGGSLQPHLPSLLSLTTNLRQLSLFIDVEYSVSPLDLDDDYDNDTEGLPTGLLQYPQIWTMLSHLKNQLEYLDLYQTALCPPSTSTSNTTAHNPPFFATDDPRDPSAHIPPFCPPLTEFSKLRQLSIPLIGLYGHDCEHEPGTKFANHLPPRLESLGLYAHAEDAPWTEQYFAPLDIELENIALSATPSSCPSSSTPRTPKIKANPHLRAIVGAEFQYNTKSNPQHKNKIYPFLNHPAAKMDLAAKKVGIYCNVAGDTHMVFCGLMTIWGLMNCTLLRGSLGVLEKMDVGRIVPRGLSVYGVKGRL